MALAGKFFSDLLLRLLFAFAILTLLAATWAAFRWHGRTFPSYLEIPNGEVGAIFHPSWVETQGLRYHDRVRNRVDGPSSSTFWVDHEGQELKISAPLRRMEGRVFGSLALFPLACALIYLVLGWLLYRNHAGLPSRKLLLAFNLGIAVYLGLVFDFHTTHFFDGLFLFTFATLGILIYQLAYLFPTTIEGPVPNRRWRIFWLALGLGLALPYCYLYFTGHPSWARWETIYIGYTSLGYLIWLVRLFLLSRQPLSPFVQGFARYLFWGNFTAFFIPLLAGIALVLAEGGMPLNYAIPFTLLFPASMVMATLFARLSESRSRLIQSEKMAAIGSLLGGMAHELNNPLNLISANLDLLRDYVAYLGKLDRLEGPPYRGQLSPREVLAELGTIGEEMALGTTRASEMMQLLKKMGRAEESPKERFLVRPLVEEACKFLTPRFPNLESQYRNSVPKEAWLHLPRTLFLELVLNLLANSAAALAPEAGPDSIEVRFREEGNWSYLGILDRGGGIPPELLARVRDPFFTTRPPGEGSGLGLSMAERWVRTWGASLEIESELGEGTRVWVKIPR